MDALTDFILDESKWLATSMGVAFAAVGTVLYRRRRDGEPTRQRVATALNLFFGVTIGSMAFGHLLAVTTKAVLGNLVGSVPFLYSLGLLLALPAACLIRHALARVVDDDGHRRRTMILNGWLALMLVGLGPLNAPLAAPALFNVGFELARGRRLSWAIAGLAAIAHVGLFIGALIFLASGGSFEEFSR